MWRRAAPGTESMRWPRRSISPPPLCGGGAQCGRCHDLWYKASEATPQRGQRVAGAHLRATACGKAGPENTPRIAAARSGGPPACAECRISGPARRRGAGDHRAGSAPTALKMPRRGRCSRPRRGRRNTGPVARAGAMRAAATPSRGTAPARSSRHSTSNGAMAPSAEESAHDGMPSVQLALPQVTRAQHDPQRGASALLHRAGA